MFSGARSFVLALAGVLVLTQPTLADDKRPLPDYDGRGNEDKEGGHWALWIPRVALAPLYFVNEYVLRRPLGALVRRSERDHWVQTVTDVFTFGPQDNYLIVPTGLFDYGLRPSIGLYFAGDNVFRANNNVRLHASTGGRDYVTVTALDRYTFNHNTNSLAARFEFTRRPDFLFVGIGPSVTKATSARYGLEKLDASAIFKQIFAPESPLKISAGVRAIDFREGSSPSLASFVESGLLEMPPGFETPYTALYQRIDLTLDGRAPVPAPGSGGYLRVHGETDFDVKNDRRWVGYGAVIGGAVDLTGHQRSLKLQLGVDFVDPIRGEVPFTELAQLGSDMMPGFVAGWMTGRSTFVTQLSYTWPVWHAYDGEARFAVGNAFGEHLDGMTTRKFRLSGDIGVTSSGTRDAGVEVLFGLGTETLEDGADITSVRLSFGSRKGF